jgi:uncharacterized protein YfaS (alpha-2-macroglobulin family)
MNPKVLSRTAITAIVFLGVMSMSVYGLSKFAVAQQGGQANDENNNGVGSERSEEAKTMYKPEYPTIGADSGNSLTLQTDKHLYKPGEDLTVRGSIVADVVANLGDIDTVKITVMDNRGSVIADDDAELGSDGLFGTSFTLPEDAALGAYTAQARVEADAEILDTIDASVSAQLSKSVKFAVVSPVAFAVKAADKDFEVKVATNSSSVRDFAFEQAEKKVSFKVEGETGTQGVAQVTLPKELLAGKMTVTIDGRAVAEDSNDVVVTSDTATEITLELNYHHSEHTVEIIGTSVVPEFTIAGIVLAAAIGAVVALVSIAGKGKFLRI